MSNPVIKIEGLEPLGTRPVPTSLVIKTEALAHRGSVQKLLAEDDPQLKTISEPFNFENPKYSNPISLAQSLIMSMRAYGGVGLSAIQIGMPVRVFCIGYENQNQVFFNPVIEEYSEEKDKIKEGCISYPFCFVVVERSKWIRISWQNEKGEKQQEVFSGYTARIIQHEYDHMDGITLPDKISNLTWKMVKEKSRGLYKKALKMEARRHT
jgi:peptide deformylase